MFIGVDFDGTLVNHDTALPGARHAMMLLREMGHKIIIHSCNNKQWIEKVCAKNDIPYDYISAAGDQNGKPVCTMYIDDRGFRFTGWEKDLPVIIGMLSNAEGI